MVVTGSRGGPNVQEVARQLLYRMNRNGLKKDTTEVTLGGVVMRITIELNDKEDASQDEQDPTAGP